MKTWTQHSFVLSQITRLTDRQTDGLTEFSSLNCVSISFSVVKTRHRCLCDEIFGRNMPEKICNNTRVYSPGCIMYWNYTL